MTDLRELLEATSNRDRAERDNRSKDEFLAMLAHELRRSAQSPMPSECSSSRTPTASPRTAHEVIARQVGHISQLISDLLDVERVVSGKSG